MGGERKEYRRSKSNYTAGGHGLVIIRRLEVRSRRERDNSDGSYYRSEEGQKHGCVGECVRERTGRD